MEQNLRDKLIKDYPNWCGNGRKYVGFEFGDGWLPIIKEMFDELVVLTKDTPKFRINQIKEKFGQLTVYFSGGNEAIKEAIDRAEVKCYETCDRCGDKGVMRNDDWIKVRCDLHVD
jgi:hypothetical protein